MKDFDRYGPKMEKLVRSYNLLSKNARQRKNGGDVVHSINLTLRVSIETGIEQLAMEVVVKALVTIFT